MRVVMPSNTVPKKEGTYEVKLNALHDGLRRWFKGDEYLYKGWITMPQFGDIVHCLVQEKEWYSETTDWFDAKEFVPPVPGFYECRVASGLYPYREMHNNYMHYWNGKEWLFCGCYFKACPWTHLTYNETRVLFFRGVKHEWKNK